MMIYQDATHSGGTAWNYLSSHFASIIAFLAGMVTERIKKWFDNRNDNKKKFSMQVSQMRLLCKKITSSYLALEQLLNNYDKTTDPVQIPPLRDEYDNTIKQLVLQIERVKASFPDRAVIYEVRNESGLDEYNRLQEAIQDIESFATEKFDQLATTPSGKRVEKLRPFQALKEPFSLNGATAS